MFQPQALAYTLRLIGTTATATSSDDDDDDDAFFLSVSA